MLALKAKIKVWFENYNYFLVSIKVSAGDKKIVSSWQ